VVWLRAAIVALLGFWTIRIGAGAADGCALDLVNLAFHEAGHLFLAPFGQTLHFLGGTLGQLGVPIGLAFYFLLAKRQPYSAAVCLWWAGQNLVGIARYMADARDLALPLVGGGDHDWNNLFYTFGLLGEESVSTVARLTRLTGFVTMCAGLGWGTPFLLSAARRSRFTAFVGERAPGLLPLFAEE